jgi:hypothetical protein
MSISVMMAICFAMKDGSAECNVSAMYNLPTTNNVEMCTRMADAKINDILLESGKEGWATGVCFPQDKYSAVVTRSVSFLEAKGYKVNFEGYKGN